jgi:hypothetical protein
MGVGLLRRRRRAQAAADVEQGAELLAAVVHVAVEQRDDLLVVADLHLQVGILLA